MIDRHKEIGNPYDTYGYAVYKNTTDNELTVHWRCYGVLNKNHKLVLCNDDSFTLSPNEERKEVYSYTGGLYYWKHFEKYVIAIEVTKGAAKAMTPEKMYKTYKKKADAGDLNQDDYTQICDWLEAYFNSRFMPLMEEMIQAYESNDEAQGEALMKKVDRLAPEIENAIGISEIVENAYKDNELNYENCKKWERIEARMEEFMRTYSYLYE